MTSNRDTPQQATPKTAQEPQREEVAEMPLSGERAESAVPKDADRVVSPASSAVDPKLLEFLVCPLTKTTLIYDAARQELISRAAGVAFPIRSGVPLMIEEAARPLTDDDLARIGRTSR